MKILLIKTSSMGDLIHTLPALTEAHNKVPDLSFDWVVESSFAEIPRWHNAVNRVVPIALRKWRKNPLQAISEHGPQNFLSALRAEYYDYVIDAQGLLKSAVVAKIARGNKYGFSFDSAREPFASLFYRHKYHIAKDQHAINRIRQLFSEILNYKLEADVIDYGLESSSLISNLEILERDKYLVFVHGTTSNAKCWQEQKWIALANLAAQKNFIVKLPWGNEEELKRAQRIKTLCSNVEVLPKMTLTAIAGVLYGAAFVVAVDTGLGHLSAALNKPTISLYGKTDPKLIGTVGKRVHHVLDFQNIAAETVWSILESIII